MLAFFVNFFYTQTFIIEPKVITNQESTVIDIDKEPKYKKTQREKMRQSA